MLWDPKGFPKMIYEFNKEEASMPGVMRKHKELLKMLPWRTRLLVKVMYYFQALGLFLPKDFSKVKDMKKLVSLKGPTYFNYVIPFERSGILEYLEDTSKTDEHYFRMYESSDCWGLENVGAPIASHIPPVIAGNCGGIEVEERN